MKAIKNVTLVLKPNAHTDYYSFLPSLTKWLLKRKFAVQFDEAELGRLKKFIPNQLKSITLIPNQLLHRSSDLIVSLGGDGTLLGVARKSKQGSPPILGVNMGKLGFITEFSKSEVYDELERVIKKKHTVEKIALFRVDVLEKDKVIFQGQFLNDAVINKNDISRIFSLSLETEDEHIYNISGDGIIISSPIGSTAYSLAAGGPIIHPNVQGVVVTPICPHSLTHRPIVLPNNFKLNIKSGPRSDSIMLTLDGQEAVKIASHHRISISKSPRTCARLVRNADRDYFLTLKEKFTHGRRDFK